jgi:hypothetical protein
MYFRFVGYGMLEATSLPLTRSKRVIPSLVDTYQIQAAVFSVGIFKTQFNKLLARVWQPRSSSTPTDSVVTGATGEDRPLGS